MTRNNICYNLSSSTFFVTIGNCRFVFSSELHKEKFLMKYLENREILAYSLSKRFGVKITLTNSADILLYSKVETRGFLVIVNNVKCNSLSEIEMSLNESIRWF